MSWWGGAWWGNEESSGSSISFPAITGTTTPANIRDRIITLITAITPTNLEGDKYRVTRDLTDADFRAACLSSPQSCLRRFQVRKVGKRGNPQVSNVDAARHDVAFEIVVAYPNTYRYGAAAGRDRDDVIDEDLAQLDFAVGLYSRGSFTVATSSDCTPLGFEEDPPVETEGAVSFLVILARYEYVHVVPR